MHCWLKESSVQINGYTVVRSNVYIFAILTKKTKTWRHNKLTTNDIKNDQLNLVLKEKGRNLIVGELAKVVTRITLLVCTHSLAFRTNSTRQVFLESSQQTRNCYKITYFVIYELPVWSKFMHTNVWKTQLAEGREKLKNYEIHRDTRMET